MESVLPASGDIAATASSSASASPAAITDSTTSAAPATQALANPITESTSEPPKERWPDILTNARTKARDDALAEWRQEHGWAEHVDRTQLDAMAQWYGRYKGNPAEFLELAYHEALQDPIHGATVKGQVARMLASMRSRDQPEAEIAPDIPVLNDQGQEVSRTYSADAMKQIIAKTVRDLLGKEIDPLKQDLQTRQSREQAAQLQQQAGETLKQAAAWHGFTEHKDDIAKVFKANPTYSLERAYLDVFHRVILPKLNQSAQATVLSDFQKKAQAQTAHPGASNATTKPTFKTSREALEYFDKHPDEAAAMAHR